MEIVTHSITHAYNTCQDSTESLYEAVTKTLPPAPESIIHLKICYCKTSCIIFRCKYHKSGLKCSAICQTNDCENNKNDDLFNISEQVIEEENDGD